MFQLKSVLVLATHLKLKSTQILHSNVHFYVKFSEYVQTENFNLTALEQTRTEAARMAKTLVIVILILILI